MFQNTISPFMTILIVTMLLVACKGTEKPAENKLSEATIGAQKASQLKAYPNIKIFESKNGTDIGPCEPSIYINPKNTDEMVAGSVIDYVHRSIDGGKTWTSNKLSSSLGVWGDPAITADKDGNFYYFHLSDPEGTNWSSDKILDRIVVQKSSDAGKNWTTGVGIGLNPPKQQDKEWPTTNPKTGELYASWTEFDRYGSSNPKDKSRILFASSNDGGTTWSSPVSINQYEGNCIDDDKTVEGAVPSSDGQNLYIAWGYDSKIWFDRSEDNGKTWLTEDIIVTDQKSGWDFTLPGLNRTNGMPVTAVDISDSPNKGTVYINWTTQISADDTDVFIAKSTDKGASWSAPSRVNTDLTNTHQFLSWMSVDAITGYVYIVYYDRSRHEDANTDVALAISKDGGITFENMIISERSFDPSGCPFFGDYNNISAHNGIVRPIWTHYEDKKSSIWTALIEEGK